MPREGGRFKIRRSIDEAREWSSGVDVNVHLGTQRPSEPEAEAGIFSAVVMLWSWVRSPRPVVLNLPTS